jgi:hypothetical protein
MITIKVIERTTGKVVKQYECETEKKANSVNFYLDHQMNHTDYYAEESE